MASPSQDTKNAGDSSDSRNAGYSYYNSMVVAAIVAAFALLALVIVTALYLKRTTTYKAIISGDKKSSGMRANGSALPAFKVRNNNASNVRHLGSGLLSRKISTGFVRERRLSS